MSNNLTSPTVRIGCVGGLVKMQGGDAWAPTEVRTGRHQRAKSPIGFGRVNAAARGALPAICARWLADGHREGREWLARNPTRADRRPGSFKVNLSTGRWADFATSDGGGDPISLAAYLHNLTQAEAARQLAAMLGVDEGLPA